MKIERNLKSAKTKEQYANEIFEGYDDQDYEEAVKDKNLLSIFLDGYFPKVNKLFKKNEYVPNNIDEANSFLMYDVLDMNNKEKLTACYEDGKKVRMIDITPTTFYRAYNSGIWELLSLPERARIVQWHFNYKKNQVQQNKIIMKAPYQEVSEDDERKKPKLIKDKLKLVLLPHSSDAFCFNNRGLYCPEDNRIYINFNMLTDNDPLELALSIEHEFEHVKQFELSEFLDKRNPQEVNLYELIRFAGFDIKYINIKGMTKAQKQLIYFGDPMEIVAEKRGLKNLLRYFKDNEKYGLFDTKQKWNYKDFRDYVKRDDLIFQPHEFKRLFVTTKKGFEDYKKRKTFINKLNYIFKLSILRLYYETTKDEETSVAHEKIEKIDKCLSEYLKTNKKNKTLENEVYEKLNLIKE